MVGARRQVREAIVAVGIGQGAGLAAIEGAAAVGIEEHGPAGQAGAGLVLDAVAIAVLEHLAADGDLVEVAEVLSNQIGRASCRERVEISVVGVSLKKKIAEYGGDRPRM